MKVKLSLLDVSADFRRQFGDEAERTAFELLGRPLPETDWRWNIEFGEPGAGGDVTFGRRATAEQVAEEIAKNGWEL